MNLQPLYETQKTLDQRIIKQHGLEGQDLLPQKILALQVELGECANEWRGFKFWSKNQEPRTKSTCNSCNGRSSGYFSGVTYTGKLEKCIECNGTGRSDRVNPLLEEYVDCLHFILSIGLELEVNEELVFEGIPQHSDVLMFFAKINRYVAKLWWEVRDADVCAGATWYHAVTNFIRLGELLGFTWNQIEQAYYSKNEINHTRQDTGY